MRYLALLLISCLSLPVFALTQVDIYQAEIVIDGDQKEGEDLARQKAMQEIIVRSTGNESSLTNPAIVKALESSSGYVSQLSYDEINGERSMKMRFNGDQIRSLLTQAKLPLWSTNRANILVWMVEENNYDRAIVWEHSESKNASALQKAAVMRGLPVTLPIGDFDDVTGINASDIWGGFVSSIGQASQRYPVDAVLVVRAQSDSFRWTLYDQLPGRLSESTQWSRSGSASGENAITAIVDKLVDYYAKKTAVVVTNDAKSIDVKVVNISSAMDFFRLENAMKQLSSVFDTEIKHVQDDGIILTVDLLASKQAFEQEVSAIAQLSMMEVKQPDTEQPQQNVTSEAVNNLETIDTSELSVDEGLTAPESQPSTQIPYDLLYQWQTLSTAS
ncbi:DUF2066 domain-containing protein [Vibrio sagamiensis]|uniref:DUF2066 domain-containing protein n=1 Tax=Vibrio sagamiensis TaxID=512650 RepID=UPI0003A89293|nr:DUF2066 domain-containing protein [Vibrio sagamiensis]